MDFLAGLNPEQRAAVLCTEGPLLILAGAGSGKTRVITHRIAHIITTRQVPPYAILAVTFTNKAADEMRTRVGTLLKDLSLDSVPQLSTFHSFCVRLLRRDGDPLGQLRPGFNRRFTIYDDDDQLVLIKAAFRRLGLDEKFMQYRAALSRISHAKNLKQSPRDFYDNATDPTASKLAVIWEDYERALRTANALDFDDLLLETVHLLAQDENTRALYNRRLRYIMIDEYQDTNRCQYELTLLLSQGHNNVCVVGDEDQSIYSWRGADIRNILDFERDFPGAQTIRLERNYRSTKNILDAAGAVVAHNTERKGKVLWTEAGEGESIGVYSAWDAENEALFIADTIERLMAADPKLQVAILYRTNFQSRQIEEALRRHGRQYAVVGGFSFYQRAEIKDIIAYLKLALSNQDSVSLLRVVNTPARGIGRTTIDQLDAYARQHGISLWEAISRTIDQQLLPPRSQSALVSFRSLVQELSLIVQSERLPDALKFVLDRTGYGEMLQHENTPESQGRLENLGELVNAAVDAEERGEKLSDFLDHAALVSDADGVDERAPISLLTLHNAKGLEFPVVFLAGMEEGLFPHQRCLNVPSALEEERRLCYVGMTRARQRLYLSWARLRRRFGGGEQERSIPSRFLAEVPRNLVVALGKGDGSGHLNLDAEQVAARQGAQRNNFMGKTYNSVENISRFFAERGMPFPERGSSPAGGPPAPTTPGLEASGQPGPLHQASPPGLVRKRNCTGMKVEHPKYGTGTVVRREGEGESAKITVNFPGYGLKKLVEKYAGLKRG